MGRMGSIKLHGQLSLSGSRLSSPPGSPLLNKYACTDLDGESDLRPLLGEVVPAEDEDVPRRDVRHAGQRVRVNTATTVAIAVA